MTRGARTSSATTTATGQFADESGSYDEDLAPFSYMNLALEAGDYGVLIKGKYRTTKGAYHVTYDCNSGRNCR